MMTSHALQSLGVVAVGWWLVRCYAGPQLFLFQTAGCMLYWGKNRERFANHEINYFAVMLWIINYRLYRGPWCWAGVVLTVLYELTNCLISFIFFFSCMIIFVVSGHFSTWYQVCQLEARAWQKYEAECSVAGPSSVSVDLVHLNTDLFIVPQINKSVKLYNHGEGPY